MVAPKSARISPGEVVTSWPECSPVSLKAVCLCAAWCRACEAYAPLFASIQPPWSARWIDIEDEAALVGDVEIETFPTLLLFDDEAIRFAGPVRPDASTLQALLRAAEQGPAIAVEAPLAALVERLRDDARRCCAP